MNRIILVFFLSCVLFAAIGVVAIVIDSSNIDIFGNKNDNQNDNECTIQEAFEYAEKNILTLDGVLGVSWSEDPPRIIIYVTQEHADDMPETVKGFETEIRISDDFKSYES